VFNYSPFQISERDHTYTKLGVSVRPLLSRNSTRAQGVQAVEAVQAVDARMPGGAKCAHGKRRRECSRCSLCAPCPHGNVPRRCFKCKSPKRQAKTTVGEMLIPGFGCLTTPASLEAGVRGQPTFTRAMLCDHAPDVPVAMLAPLVCKTACATCDRHGLAAVHSLHAWTDVMTHADSACAQRCTECNSRVFPVTARSAIAMHSRQDCNVQEAALWRPQEAALWHMKDHSDVGAAFASYQTDGRVIRARCTSCMELYFVDYVYGQAVRLQLRDQKAYVTGAKPLQVMVQMVRDIIVPDIRAGTARLVYDWDPCQTCHTGLQWPKRSQEAFAAAHQAAARLGWVSLPRTLPHTQACVPIGVPVPLCVEELQGVLPRLASGAVAHLDLIDVMIAVMLVVKEVVAPLVGASEAELRPLKGAPGLATLAGAECFKFGSMHDCAAAAGGERVDAGIVIIASLHQVRDGSD
jgi:hypothetical protein